MSTTIETDVLIIGAGPAGAAAALFLAKEGIKSVVVDKSTFPRDKICGDALSGKVVEVLNKLDPSLIYELDKHPAFLDSWGVTFVAPNGEPLRIPFVTKKEKNTAPGFISRRTDFDNWLAGKMKCSEHVQLFEETEIRHYRQNRDYTIAEAKNGLVFHARMVIACDGAYSTFSKNVAALITEPAHNCFGLRAYYENVQGLDAENFIELHFLREFLPGYFWIFPLPNGCANVGVGMRADKMSARKVNLKTSFHSILEKNDTLRTRFAHARPTGDVKMFGLPLGSRKRKISGHRYLLCGDAAQLIDPFTGEGIGNAMMSGMYAAHQAAQSIQRQNFSAEVLAGYDAAVYGRLWSELLLSHRMQQLVAFPSLFNFVVKKANRNAMLRETISCMFEDLDMRARLSNPMFYLNLLFSSLK